MVYLREQHRLIRNDLRTGEFQGAYWCWFTATSHNTWFFLSEELRAGLDDGTAICRIRCMEVIPFGMEQKGRPYRARVLKFSLWGVQRAVSKFNDQPDSWSHSGSSYQILRRLVPCRPHDRLHHENLLEIWPFLTLAITTATEHFLVINYHKFVRESSYTKSIALREGLYGIQITSVTLQGMMFLLVEIERLRSTQRLAWRNLDNSRINWFVNCSEISQESQDVFDVEVDTIRSRKPVSPIHVVGSHASLVRIARTW